MIILIMPLRSLLPIPAHSANEMDSTAQETSNQLFRFITTVDSVNTPASNMQTQEIITSNQPVTVSSSRWAKLVLEKLYKALMELVTKVGEFKQELSPAMYRAFREAERFARGLCEVPRPAPYPCCLHRNHRVGTLDRAVNSISDRSFGLWCRGCR